MFIQTDKGGWRSLCDYASSCGLHYTLQIVTTDEELLVHELGERVVNAMLEKSIDGWDALMDASYDAYCKAHGAVRPHLTAP